VAIFFKKFVVICEMGLKFGVMKMVQWLKRPKLVLGPSFLSLQGDY
jgi:hypothetical protein